MQKKKENHQKETLLSEFGLPIAIGWLAVILLAITTIRSAIMLSDYFVYMQFVALVLLSITFLLFFFGLRRKYEDLWNNNRQIELANEQTEIFRKQQKEAEELLQRQTQIALRTKEENIEQGLKKTADEIINTFSFSGVSVWVLTPNEGDYEPEFIYRKHEGILQKTYFRPLSNTEKITSESSTSLKNPVQALINNHLRAHGVTQEMVIPIQCAHQQQALCCFENQVTKLRSTPEKNALSMIASTIALFIRLRYTESVSNHLWNKNRFTSQLIRKNLSAVALFRLQEPVAVDGDVSEMMAKIKTGQIPIKLDEYSHGLLSLLGISDIQQSPNVWFSALRYDEIFPKFANQGFGKFSCEITHQKENKLEFYDVFLAGMMNNQKLVGWWHLQTDKTALKTELIEKRSSVQSLEKLYSSLLKTIPERYPSTGQWQLVLKRLLRTFCTDFSFDKTGIWKINQDSSTLDSVLIFDQAQAHFTENTQIELESLSTLSTLGKVEKVGQDHHHVLKEYCQVNHICDLWILPIRWHRETKEMVLLETTKKLEFNDQQMELLEKIAHLLSIYYTFIAMQSSLTHWKTECKSYQGLFKNTDYAMAKFSLDIPISLKAKSEEQIKAVQELAMLSEFNAEMKAQSPFFDNDSSFPFKKLLSPYSENKTQIVFDHLLNTPFRYTDTEVGQIPNQAKISHLLKSYVAIIEGDFITGVWVLQKEVTQLTRNQATVLKSEKQYQTLVKFQRDAVALLNPKGVFLYTNPRFNEFAELESQETKHKKITDFIYPDDENRFSALLEEIIRNPKTPQIFITQFLNHTGIWRNVELFLSNESQEIIVLTLRDITQQRQATRQATWREQRLRKVLNANVDPIFIINAEYHIHFVNMAAEKVMGCKLDESTQFWADFIHDADQNKTTAFIEKVRNAAIPCTEFLRFRNDQLGAWRNVRVYAQNYTEDHDIKGIVIQLTDFQDYSIENRNLIYKLNRRDDLLETVREGIAILDSDGNFRYANRAFAQILDQDDGKSFVEEKVNVEDLLTTESKHIMSAFETILQKSESHFTKGFYLKKNREEQIWVEGFMINLLRNEHISGIVFSIWENTQQKNQLDDLTDTEESLRLFLENSAQISAFTNLRGRIFSSAGFDQTFGKPRTEADIFDAHLYAESLRGFVDESFRRVHEDGLIVKNTWKRKNITGAFGDYQHYLRKIQSSRTDLSIIIADFTDKTDLLARESDLRFHKQVLEDERQDKKVLMEQHQLTITKIENEQQQTLQTLLEKKDHELQQVDSDKKTIIHGLEKDLHLLSKKLSDAEKPALLGRVLAHIALVVQQPVMQIRDSLPELRRMLEEFREILDKYTEINPEINLKAKLEEIQLLKDITNFEKLNQHTDHLLAQQAQLSNQLVEISDNLMTFTDLKSTYNTHLDLNRVIENTLRLIFVEADHSIEMVKKYADHAYISGYENQIAQLLVCLLHNAKESIQKHGYIFMNTWNTPEVVGFSLKDTGKGMDKETQNMAFDRFFTTKNPSQHAGTGLYLVREIADTHQATIELESEVEKGTKISIFFPKQNI